MFTGLESPTHLLVLAVVALLVFGPKRLPEFGRALGSGLRGFRDAVSPDDMATKPESPPTAGRGKARADEEREIEAETGSVKSSEEPA